MLIDIGSPSLALMLWCSNNATGVTGLCCETGVLGRNKLCLVFCAQEKHKAVPSRLLSKKVCSEQWLRECLNSSFSKYGCSSDPGAPIFSFSQWKKAKKKGEKSLLPVLELCWHHGSWVVDASHSGRSGGSQTLATTARRKNDQLEHRASFFRLEPHSILLQMCQAEEYGCFHRMSWLWNLRHGYKQWCS